MTAFLRRYYAGGGTTTSLSAGMGASDTSFTVNSATGWPGSPGVDFLVVIDRGTSSEEKVSCSSNTGTSVTVAARGADGTSATTHNSGATVSLCGGAIDFDEANQLTNLMGNAAGGSIFYGSGVGALPGKVGIGTAGQLLGNNGSIPTWLAALAEGSIHYGKGTTTAPAALAIGSSGYVLTSNGTDPTWQYPALTTTSSYISSNNNVTLDTSTNITSVSLGSGTWLVAGTVVWETASGSNQVTIDAWLGPTSASATGAYGDSSAAFVQNASFVTGDTLSVTALVTVASTTTVYLECYASQNITVLKAPFVAAVTNVTGISAVRIA